MKAEDTHEVEVVLHLRVPKALPQRHVERMRMALVSTAADMDHVIEAGVQDMAGQPTYAQLAGLWNAVSGAAPIVNGMAPADPVWGGMTCTEAEAIAGIFAAGGYPDVAEFALAQHALGDDDPEDTHHEEFLKVMKEAGA